MRAHSTQFVGGTPHTLEVLSFGAFASFLSSHKRRRAKNIQSLNIALGSQGNLKFGPIQKFILLLHNDIEIQDCTLKDNVAQTTNSPTPTTESFIFTKFCGTRVIVCLDLKQKSILAHHLTTGFCEKEVRVKVRNSNKGKT